MSGTALGPVAAAAAPTAAWPGCRAPGRHRSVQRQPIPPLLLHHARGGFLVLFLGLEGLCIQGVPAWVRARAPARAAPASVRCAAGRAAPAGGRALAAHHLRCAPARHLESALPPNHTHLPTPPPSTHPPIPQVHLVNMASSGAVESVANVTDIHETLDFGGEHGPCACVLLCASRLAAWPGPESRARPPPRPAPRRRPPRAAGHLGGAVERGQPGDHSRDHGAGRERIRHDAGVWLWCVCVVCVEGWG